jgi:hypothetical protein
MTRRRRKSVVSGTGATEREHRVASVLQNTYNLERNRHLSNQHLLASAYEPGKWHEQLFTLDEANFEDSLGHQPEKHWLELARRLLAEEIDPETFVRRQFHMLRPEVKPPFPNQLNTPLALKNFELGKEQSLREIRLAFKTQVQLARNNIQANKVVDGDNSQEDTFAAWDAVLDDDDSPLSALFRYCLARNEYESTKDDRFKDIVEQYYQPAALQYLQDPEAYDEVWGSEWIPDWFLAAARKVFNSVYGRE